MTEYIEKINWPWRKTQFNPDLPCLYLADPASFLASNRVVGILFSSENSLFIQLWVCYYFIN